MAAMVRRRMEVRTRSFEPPSWFEASEAPPAGRASSVLAVVAGLVALLCLAWWATSTQLLVGSAWREGGRVLACQYLVGTRVVERQYLLMAHEANQHACSLVRFG
jgi:hypothetical protein